MSAHNQFELLGERRFGPFFLTQFLGAANDNLFKFAFTVLATYQAAQWGGVAPSMAGFVIFAGEFVGGGISPIIAGKIAGGEYGLKGALYFAACGLVVGFIVALFLKETAPRKQK